MNNLRRIEAALLDTESAWNQIEELIQSAQKRAAAAGLPGGRFQPRNRPGAERRAESRPPTRATADLAGPGYPWYWSAGVLVGLFGLSVWILSLRVKSLDRLK
jgi:hypothetical protein